MKKHLSKSVKRKISKALKKYWASFEGKQRKHEYFQVPPGKAKEYREAVQKAYRSNKRGEYDIRLYSRQPKGGYKKVPLEAFKKGHSYLVYIVHRATNRSRLLSSGRINDLPVATHKQTKEWFAPVISENRKFKPLKLKKRGKWLPITRFYNKALKNIELQKNTLKENYKIRGAILPLKRYYNPELMIFSDEPVPRKKRVKVVFAHVVTAYDYPNIRWISARHVKVEFKEGIRIDELSSKLEEIEDLATEALSLEHPKAGVRALMIDGFIPVKFEEGSRKKRKKKRRK